MDACLLFCPAWKTLSMNWYVCEEFHCMSLLIFNHDKKKQQLLTKPSQFNQASVFLSRDSALGCRTSSEWSEWLRRFSRLMVLIYDSTKSLLSCNALGLLILCMCVLQWGKNKSQMWHGCCSLPVFPASPDRPSHCYNRYLTRDYSPRELKWRPAGWVLDSFIRKSEI